MRLEGSEVRKHQPKRVLRELIAEGKLICAPGAYDGLSARIVERAGFDAVYVSGGAVARSKGVPDLGLLSLTEVVDRTAEIVDSVDIPVIADADTGYGGFLSVARTVREFERCGVAALHIEDQVIPKKCGHYEGKTLVDLTTMLGRLRAALDARSDPDLVIIARTDARAVNGLDDALERAMAYAEAGADLVFVEAPESIDEIERIAREIPAPLVINMFAGGKTPLMSAGELERLGYRVMIVPSDLQRAGIFAMEQAAAILRDRGSNASYAEHMVTFSDREMLVDQERYVALEDKYVGLDAVRSDT